MEFPDSKAVLELSFGRDHETDAETNDSRKQPGIGIHCRLGKRRYRDNNRGHAMEL